MKKNSRHPLLIISALLMSFLCCQLSCAGLDSSINKLDPALKAFFISGKTAHLAPGRNIPHIRRPDTINAIAKFSGSPLSLESKGIRVRSVTGDIATLDIPMHLLDDLLEMPEVKYIQNSRQMRPAVMDVSVPETGADQVWSSIPGYTGRGVIVGIIDAGIDWKNPDFDGQDGSTRILYIWDQTVHTPALYPEYGYGTEWTKAHIDSGQCQQMDATSHGTHVTSIMAGYGGDRHKYTGMAPEANIIAVKTTFEDADIVDAADYIFRKADELNMPAVIDMSFGSHWGAHDGTELLDQALDELLAQPGRVIVASAGNDADSGIHASTPSLRSPVVGNYPWTAILPSVGTDSFGMQIWYPADEYLSVRLILPDDDGNLGNRRTEWVSTGQFEIFSVISGFLTGAEIVMDADLLATETLHPDFNGIYIRISDDDDRTIPIDDYVYGIEYDGGGFGLDAYVLWGGRFTRNFQSGGSAPSRTYLLDDDVTKTIISPSSASKVICVGAYATKSEWVDSQNRIRTADYLQIGDLSVFSSLGPLLNGRRKPELAAPGEMIVAAFSSDSWSVINQKHRDGKHLVWRGTSMSSPHVGGAAALIFQKNPDLMALEVRSILTSTATDAGPAGWDKGWGYGKLNALAALGIPATPKGLSLTENDDGSLSVTWSLNSERDMAGYIIEADSRTFDVKHPESNYRITDLAGGVPVALSIRAYDSDGNESRKSQEVIITPNLPTPDNVPPPPPENLLITPISTAADLNWSPVLDHDLSGYRVYYGTSPEDYSRNLWAGKGTEYRIKNLTNGRRVYVAVTAVDTSGNESGKSSEVSDIPRLFSIPEHRNQAGWPVSVQHDVFSSVTLYDIDGDGLLEVAASARDGEIYLLRHDGGNIAGWPVPTGFASVSSPALGDMDGDGQVELAVGSGRMIYLWHSNGLRVAGWPVEIDDSIVASPALGDIDEDGIMELVVSSRSGRIYAYNMDGSVVDNWPFMTFGTVNSSAALGDIDNDGGMEMVVGSGSGSIYVLKADRTMADGWPIYVGPAFDSSPVLGDITGDGFMEIIAADVGGGVYAWRYDGKPLDGWPVDLGEVIGSSPVIGDINADGDSLEIAICTRYGSLYVLKNNGEVMDGWPVAVMDIVTSPPVLGDIDGNGSPDVVVATGTGQGYTGLIYAFMNTGRALGSSRWPISVGGNIQYSSPALGDLDGDGDVEIVVGSSRLADGTGGQINAWDLTGRLREDSILWGGFRHDAQHTGIAGDTIPPSFTIAAVQNSALKSYLNVYVVASEPVEAPPDMTIAADSDNESARMILLTLIDSDAHIYRGDFSIASSGTYKLTASGTDFNGNFGQTEKSISIKLDDQTQKPAEMASAKSSLLPNYPNPFNPGTWIPYELAQPAQVNIYIYSLSGNLIRSMNLGHRKRGNYTSMDTAAYWDGRDNRGQMAASGVYFYVMEAGNFKAAGKMILSN